MKQILVTVIFILLPVIGYSQIERESPPTLNREQLADQQKRQGTGPKLAPITEYRIISIENDTTSVDTSLTIHKNYKFNYLRKDNFELLPFSNVGQTYNKLAYDFTEDDHLLPQFGARARHYNFMEVEDIYYYHVPTPFTELYFKTVFEQGQTLDAFFTINTSKNLNISIAYKGLRSLGKYQHMLVSTGNFRTTVSYNTPNERYFLKTHFVSQDLMNEENGGLTGRSLENYISKEPEFDDRSRLDVRFEDAESTLYGKRFFLEHSYKFGSLGSSPSNSLSVGHRLNHTYKKFVFQQATADDFFGPSFENVNVRDETRLEETYNEAFLGYSSDALGEFRLKSGYTHYSYGYNTVLDLETGFIENRLIGNVIAAGASYSNKIGEFYLAADGMMNISGDMGGYNFGARLSYSLDEDIWAALNLDVNDRAPNWNFLLNQSDYINYNWRNSFSNLNTQGLTLDIFAPRWINLEAAFTRIGNYTYFAANEEGFIKPFQDEDQVSYARVKAERDFEFGKFALANTVLFQKVLEGQDVLNVPSFITRNSFYYQDHWFKRALYLQTGFTANYFHDYQMNGYDPVLAEFYVQNEQEFEGLRSLDFFFNGKIRQARIFFKLERLDALLLGNNNFAAPGYPYRDFAIRFGLVWNFFM